MGEKRAVIILVRKGTRILLLKRKNTGWRDGYWACPSGHVEAGEDAFTAARRELAEEAGLSAIKASVVTTQRRAGYLDYLVAVEWRGNPRNAEPGKSSKIKWHETLPRNFVPEHRDIVQEALDGG